MSTSYVKNKWYELFCGCFKIVHRQKSNESLTNYDPKEYDYIVEKLIVKRVPLRSLTLSKTAIENKSCIYDVQTQKSLLLQATDSIYCNILPTASFSHSYESSNEGVIPMEIYSTSLHQDISTPPFNKSLKESMKPSREFSYLKICKANNFLNKSNEQIISLNKMSNNYNTNKAQETFPTIHSQNTSTMKKKPIIAKKLSNFKTFNDSFHQFWELQENENKISNTKGDSYANNYGDGNHKPAETFIVQHIQNTHHNPECPKQTIINSDLLKAKGISTNKFDILFTNFANTDSLNANLKWKITFKYCKL